MPFYLQLSGLRWLHCKATQMQCSEQKETEAVKAIMRDVATTGGKTAAFKPQ